MYFNYLYFNYLTTLTLRRPTNSNFQLLRFALYLLLICGDRNALIKNSRLTIHVKKANYPQSRSNALASYSLLPGSGCNSCSHCCTAYSSHSSLKKSAVTSHCLIASPPSLSPPLVEFVYSELNGHRVYQIMHLIVFAIYTSAFTYDDLPPRAGSGVVRIDPLRFLAGCRTRRLNQV